MVTKIHDTGACLFYALNVGVNRLVWTNHKHIKWTIDYKLLIDAFE